MTSKWPIYAALATVGVSGIDFAYLSSENEQNRQLSISNQTVRASVIQLQNELLAVQDQLDQLRTALRSPAPAPSAVLPQPSKGRPGRMLRVQAPATLRSDLRLNQLQKRLLDQQKQLASTREDLDKTRENFQSSLSSTKDELSGSIARSHDELVALQKRGERNYYEFHLTRSKAFERVGPLRLSLRKADIKHKRFDMMMLVDDNELQKKGVNLYETLLLNLADRPQPLEVVVNKISKEAVVGYVSEPKYKRSELSASAGLTP